MAAPCPVLFIHGAWHGGWCWLNVAPWLIAAGHRVFTPDLKGLGARADETGPIDLDVHLAELLALIVKEKLTDLFLVAHSYGGILAAGLMDRVPQHLRGALFLDAILPMPGERLVDGTAGLEEKLRAQAAGTGRIPPLAPTKYGLPATDAAMIAFAAARLMPQPLETYLQPAPVAEGWQRKSKVQFVHCTSPNFFGVIDPHAARARSFGWPVTEMATGHDAMLTAPRELAELIFQACRRAQ